MDSITDSSAPRRSPASSMSHAYAFADFSMSVTSLMRSVSSLRAALATTSSGTPAAS